MRAVVPLSMCFTNGGRISTRIFVSCSRYRVLVRYEGASLESGLEIRVDNVMQKEKANSDVLK